ncbi:MAG: LPP20 family lipoprotein [Flavobacteriales bacterium]|nr:LPP20 family lipoprotein [Flavobacteriales bacterium]
MNKLYLLLLTLFIFSCQSTKQSTELDSGIPAWVKEYPVSDSHFVGIGIADRSSHPQDYIQIAQQNALQNLSSQIKVSISSQSVFLQMDREYGYEEDYKSNIEVKANEILEGYVLAGTFSQNNEYWVYYKLDKQLYQETRLARIQEAIEESKYFLNKAIMHYTPLKDKYIYYVKALDVLEPYLSEPLKTEFDRETVFLGSEIIARFRSYIDDFYIFSLTKKIKAMIGNSVDKIKLAVQYKDDRLAEIPLITSSSSLELNNLSQETDTNGVFMTSVPKIKSTETFQKIEVGIDFQNWLDAGSESDFIKKLFKGIKTHQINVPVYVYTPTVYVQTEEKHFGKDDNGTDIRYAAESALTQLGFTPVGNKNDAQIFLNFKIDSRKGIEQKGQKMFTAFSDMSVQAKDLNKRVIFSKTVNKIKGIQLDFAQAENDSYQQAIKEVKKSIIPEFVNSFIKD